MTPRTRPSLSGSIALATLVGAAIAAGSVPAAAEGRMVPDYMTLGEPVTWDGFSSDFIGDEVRQLTGQDDSFRRAGEGYFSPDGRWMVFQAEEESKNPFFQIYRMDMTSGAVNQVSPGRGKTTCSFLRPGHDEIMFGSSHLDPDAMAKEAKEREERKDPNRRRAAWDYDATMDIFVTAGDGSNVRQLTKAEGYDAEGAFSPDGSMIVFSSTRSAYPLDELSEEMRAQAEEDLSYFGEIYVMNADGTNVQRITNAKGYDGGPFFTPDGERIVWRHFDESGRIAEVHTIRVDGTDERVLTNLGAMSWAPYFHPSGEYCIFTTNRHGYRNFELYMVDAMGEKEPVRVTDAEAFDGLPVFTPDGHHLVWTASRTPNRQGQLFAASWDHTAALKALEAAPARMQAAERETDDPHAGHAHH